MKIDELFFQLLQVTIGTRNTLDRQPTSQEWALLFNMSKKQALTAIAFVGVNKLKEEFASGDFGSSIGIDKITYLKWLGLTVKVAQRNKKVSATCVELVNQYAHGGIQCCILKGLGNLEIYPEELRECRMPGDIDVWCSPIDPSGIDIAVSDLDGKGAHYEKCHGKQVVIEYVKMLHRTAGTKPHEGVRYHHIDAPTVNGVDVEVHFRPLFLDSPLRNCRLQRWFKENEQFGLHDTKIEDYVFPTPTVSFNAVYQLCHIYRHLFDEGIGLRQLLDYYFVLRALHIEQGSLADRSQSIAQWAEGMGVAVKSNEEIMYTLGRFGMKKFAGAVMYVLARVFEPNDKDDDSGNCHPDGVHKSSAINQKPWMLCPPNEKEGKFLLNEIMQAGNFGKYDERIQKTSSQYGHAWEKLKHNFRLIKHYPEEVLCEPFFRVYHWIWRKCELWKWE